MNVFSISYSDALKSRIARLIDQRPVKLASGSPRRQDILTKLGVVFEQYSPIAEDKLDPHTLAEDPASLSIAIARHKAAEGALATQHGIVIAADTIVVLDGEILPKPGGREHAKSHLMRLAGRGHDVFTALVLRDVDSGTEVSGTRRSHVTFRKLKRDEIAEYLATGEPDDKAGAYGIQGMGKFLVAKYTGNLDNIIGFPALLFAELLEELNSRRVRR